MSPEEIILAVTAAWSRLDVEEIVTYYTPDAVYENVGVGVATGTDEIRKAIEPMLASLSSYDSEIVNMAVSGNLVFTEQIDHVVMGGTSIGFRLMQISEVKGDKISARRNYFNAAGQT
jgi:limonene-1,2-epoxide hydrolase